MAAIRRLAANVDPKVSVFEEQKSLVERTAPNVPATENWASPPIYATASVETDAEAEARVNAERQANIDEILAFFGPKSREAIGCTR